MRGPVTRVLWGLCILAALPGVAEPPALNRPALDAALKPITPAFRIPVRPRLFMNEGRLNAADLLGFDLVQDGQPVAGPVPQIQIGPPLELTLYWRPWSTRIADTQVSIAIRGPGTGPAPSFRLTAPIGIAAWTPGEVCKQRYVLETPRREFVGLGTLSIAQRWEGDQWWSERATLYAGPVYVPAVVWTSSVDGALLGKLFGDKARRLTAAFRLGPKTSVTVPAPSPSAVPPDMIGIVSSLLWDTTFRQGERVCRIDLISADPTQQATAYIESGVSTALKSYDSYAPGELPSQKIEVATTEMAADSATGQAQPRHTYAGRIRLSAPTQPAKLVFTYLRETGFLDVDEVVLGYQNPPREQGAP